ncbi:MAG: DUF177 domain-containing protein [Dehalococcoidia bacterium]
MQFNVSTLLQEPVGSTRLATVNDEPVQVPAAGYAAAASGHVRLMRTQRGVLVHADVVTRPVLECARCLTQFEAEVRLVIDEEFVPFRDPATGEAIEADPDEFRIDGRNHLDLSEAVRQYEQAALPIQPVCRDDCAGLCPVCGQNLNERRCECIQPEPQGAWAGLAALAERLRTEEHDGGPEA